MEALRAKNVPVITLNGDLGIEHLHLKIVHALNGNIEKRNSMFERAQIINLTAQEVPFYERSYVYKLSKYGPNSLFNVSNPFKSKEHSLIYRDKIYFFPSAEEKTQYSEEPDVYLRRPAVPLDVHIKPQLAVIGVTNSGKSTLCQRLHEQIGIVHLHMHEIIELFIESDCVVGQKLREFLQSGREIPEDLMVTIVAKRVQMRDCYENGWVIENFPRTREQAEALTARSIVPNFVFVTQVQHHTPYKRTLGDSNDGMNFEADRRTVARRIEQYVS